jgi:hypothetical protein
MVGLQNNTTGLGQVMTPLNSQNGIFVCLRSTDTNFQIARNDGSGATVFTDRGIANDTSAHTIRIQADDADTGFQSAMDNGSCGALFSVITTDVPSSTNCLGQLA